MTNQEAYEFVLSCWKREQSYTILAETLMEEILKDCNAGKPKEEILVKAIRCIGAGTGNAVFAKQCLEKLKEAN